MVALFRGSPTYTKISNMVSTTMVFGLCTCKWGIFPLVGPYSPSNTILCKTVFSKSQNARKRGPSVLIAINSILTLFLFISGLKFRRQHWFFLLCLVALLFTLLIIWLSSISQDSSADILRITSPEKQAEVVAQLLREVPLIDG